MDYKEMIIRMLDKMDDRTLKIVYFVLLKKIKASR